MTERPVPRATYRLQLSKDFRFVDAAGLARYLGRLGISHAYLSPVCKARPGSAHGYDTVDPAVINPELGSLGDFRAMADAFRREGIGIILDIVPNHMGIGGADNPYWLDVLRHGEASRYVRWFDIDWHSPDAGLAGKVMVPFLDRPLPDAIALGRLRLLRDADGVACWLDGLHKLPLAPDSGAALTARDIERLNADAAGLCNLLDRQHWRLTEARAACRTLNYRRFFVVSDLIGMRVEDPEVLRETHRLVFELVAEGLVDGLRVDHIDGLRDPATYLRRLREHTARPLYIVVEKILAADETLPSGWDVEGTTGYEFAALVNPLLVDPAAEEPITLFHRLLTRPAAELREIEWQARTLILDCELAAELTSLARGFVALARRYAGAALLDEQDLKRALRAYVAVLPVYRTYVAADGPSPADRKIIEAAVEAATARDPSLAPEALAFVRAVCLAELPGARLAAIDLAMRLQQLSGPVMAKGHEDTALYRYNRLVALNDVGGDPGTFTCSVAEFHRRMRAQVAARPHTMLATSSHDSKRAEDNRARIAALCGHVDAWRAAVPAWLERLRAEGAPAIDPDDAGLFFQLLLGAWPGESPADLEQRLVAVMRKSVREARLRSGWWSPDAEYEARIEGFVRLAFDSHSFIDAFTRLEAEIGRDGAVNGLIETALKLTTPGVPDLYQGAELWAQSMVDPDNRRPVDFASRVRRLDECEDGSLVELMKHWRDGAVKLALIARVLGLRRRFPVPFAAGSYEPLAIDGPDADRICAFLRRTDDTALLVAVRLYPWRRTGATAARSALPTALEAWRWLDVLDRGEAVVKDVSVLAFPEDLPIVVRFGRPGATP